MPLPPRQRSPVRSRHHAQLFSLVQTAALTPAPPSSRIFVQARIQNLKTEFIMAVRAAVESMEEMARPFGSTTVEDFMTEVATTQGRRRERAAAKGVTVEKLMRMEAQLYR